MTQQTYNPIAATAPPPAALAPARAAGAGLPSGFWVMALLALQIGCQIGLLFLGGTGARLPLRMGAFGGSLLMLVLFLPRTRMHPAAPWAMAVLFILLFGFVHPERNTFQAGLAQVAIYVSILAPLGWVAGMRMEGRALRAVVITLWLFYTASACVGVLQTLFPGQFQPTLSSIIEAKGDALLEGYKITLASGAQVFRPMGLTDTPGGAATGGLYAFVLGLGLFLAERKWFWKAACLLGMMAGLYCILLSQVRSVLIMTAICAIVFCGVLMWQLDWQRFSVAVTTLAAVTFIGVAAALVVGGQSVIDRLDSLVAEDPATVYYTGRGYHLHYMLEVQLKEYPMGAGLGRWGMINYYFGDDQAMKEPLWAEIQWTAWLFDGGIGLIVAYAGAVVMALLVAWRVAMRGVGAIGLWGAILFAYNVGALAITFNYPIFMSQGGMEFWILNACVYAAWRNDAINRAMAPAPAGIGA